MRRFQNLGYSYAKIPEKEKTMPKITIDVDIDMWEVIGEADDEYLIGEMNNRGYNVQKEEFDVATLDREDLDCLLELISDSDWQGRRVYDKLKKLRFG